MDCTIFEEKPYQFNPVMEVAGCYCQWNKKLLFVKRHPKKPYGNTWGIPSGKLESQETPQMAAIREVKEEVGLDINDNLKSLGVLYGRLPHLDYTYHIFYKHFAVLPEVLIAEEEHIEHVWVTFEEALELPLIVGGREALLYFKRHH